MTHPVENIMKTTMEQLKAMADVNTIVGNPILTAGETMILPVSKLQEMLWIHFSPFRTAMEGSLCRTAVFLS